VRLGQCQENRLTVVAAEVEQVGSNLVRLSELCGELKRRRIAQQAMQLVQVGF
jgi:hypothetical protein